MKVAAQIFLVLILATLHLEGVEGQAEGEAVLELTRTATFSQTPADPTGVKVKWNAAAGALAAEDRIYIHLPRFGGGFNGFGTYSPSIISKQGVASFDTTQATAKSYTSATATTTPEAIKLTASAGTCAIQSALWNAPIETLIIVLSATSAEATSCDSVTATEAYLTINQVASGIPNGLGPLPPLGGYDTEWFRQAYVRIFRKSECVGGLGGRPGFPSETCKFPSTLSASDKAKREIVFIKASSKPQKISTPNDRVPIHKALGPTGTVDRPRIAWSEIHGDLTGESLENCITVSFITSISLTSGATTATRITIDGLGNSGSESLEEMKLYASEKECSSTAGLYVSLKQKFHNVESPYTADTASYYKDRGELVMQLDAGKFIQAFEVVTFTFALLNPDGVQNNQKPTLTITGRYCDKDPFCDTDTEAIAVTLAGSFQNATKVLEVKQKLFTLKTILQDSFDPEKAGTRIFVTLIPNANLRSTETSSRKIKISNLCLPLNEPVTLLSNTESGGIQTGNPIDAVTTTNTIVNKNSKFVSDSNTLEITLGASGMTAGERYAFAFGFQNWADQHNPCDPSIEVDELINRQTMDGKDIGKANNPSFKVAKVGQASTRPDSINWVCVTLKPNTIFESKLLQTAKLRITGLRNFAAASTDGAQLYKCPTSLGTDGNAKDLVAPALFQDAGSDFIFVDNLFTYDKDQGEVELTLDQGHSIAYDQEMTFAFPLKNPKGDSETPCLQLRLQATSPAFDFDEDFQSSSTTARALEGGRKDGDACVGKVYPPEFSKGVIHESSPVAEEENTITITLRATQDIAADGETATASVTLSGLTGSITEDDSDFHLSTSNALKLVQGSKEIKVDRAIWDRNQGSMVISLPGKPGTATAVCDSPSGNGDQDATKYFYCMTADQDYVLSFKLRNPSVGQSARTVSVSAQSSDFLFADTALTPSNKIIEQPLFVLEPGQNDIIKTAKISQKVAAPDATNAICVTFALFQDVGATCAPATPSSWGQGQGRSYTEFQISGLSGFRSDDQDLSMFQSNGKAALTDAVAPGDQCWSPDGQPSATKKHKLEFKENDGTVSAFIFGKISANSEYSFCFKLLNPLEARGCLTPSMKMTLSDGDTDTKVMEQDMNTAITDYTKGSACVGFVAPGKFLLADLRASTNVTGNQVWFHLDLSSNYLLEKGESITLSGFSAVETVDSKSSTNELEIWVNKNGKSDTWPDITGSFQEQAEFTGNKILFKMSATGQLQPKDEFAQTAIEEADVFEIVFQLQYRDGTKTANKMFIESTTFAKQEVNVGKFPTLARIQLDPDDVFDYADWKANESPQGVTLTFSDASDGARITLPATFRFPTWFYIKGKEQPAVDYAFPTDWGLTSSQVSSTVVTLEFPANNTNAGGVAVPLTSSKLLDIDPARISRRQLVNACPDGFETRMVLVGTFIGDACSRCSQSCESEAVCDVKESGPWAAVIISLGVCDLSIPLPPSKAGIIVGVVCGIFFGSLGALMLFLCLHRPEIFESADTAPSKQDPEAQSTIVLQAAAPGQNPETIQGHGIQPPMQLGPVYGTVTGQLPVALGRELSPFSNGSVTGPPVYYQTQGGPILGSLPPVTISQQFVPANVVQSPNVSLLSNPQQDSQIVYVTQGRNGLHQARNNISHHVSGAPMQSPGLNSSSDSAATFNTVTLGETVNLSRVDMGYTMATPKVFKR